jgi:hypothetical protein
VDNKRKVSQSASLGLAVLWIAMAAPPVKGQSQEKPESEVRVALA